MGVGAAQRSGAGGGAGAAQVVAAEEGRAAGGGRAGGERSPTACREPLGPLSPSPPRAQGYDATSHFETEIHDVLDLYRRITGGRCCSRVGCAALRWGAARGDVEWSLPCLQPVWPQARGCLPPAPLAPCPLQSTRLLRRLGPPIPTCCPGKPLDLDKEDLRKRQEAH